MRTIRLVAVFLLVGCAAATVSAQSGVTVYSHDFQTPVGPEWSKTIRSTTPVGNRVFLGRFGGEPVALDLDPLPEHCSVTVSFELFIIGEWEGSVGYGAGPDVFDVNASTPGDCCPVQNLEHTTFANCECKFQAYPDTYPDVHLPGLTGADEVGTLGYSRDSVYQLSYTFFHDQPGLRVTFAATPNLEELDDESWGIDNIVVEVDDVSCCRATRELPATFGAGERVRVAIDVTPNPRAETYVIEEDPPFNFHSFNINDGGTFDGDMIKWGPFFDDTPRTLTYTVEIASWVENPVFFGGTIAVDGDREIICGDNSTAPGGTHPADMDGDFLLEAVELTAYGAAWRRGDEWPTTPNPIPADYVTNAGMLWRAGEAYVYDAGTAPPWVPAGGAKTRGGLVSSGVSSGAAGAAAVALEARPDTGTLAWSVQESLPQGYAVSAISDGGAYEAASRQIVWGPFFDDQPRTLTYSLNRIEPQASASPLVGTASFDGLSVEVSGARALSVAERAPSSVD
jgi:hypothetical protein